MHEERHTRRTVRSRESEPSLTGHGQNSSDTGREQPIKAPRRNQGALKSNK